MAILVQKLWGEKKLSKTVFGYFKTKKSGSRGVGVGVRPYGLAISGVIFLMAKPSSFVLKRLPKELFWGHFL